MFTGVGSIMNLRIELPVAGVVEIVQTYLPISPLDQQVAFHWFAERSVPRLLVWSAVGGWVSQWRNDVRVWEEMAFTPPPPMLCRDDGPVMRLRDWYRQFFPSSSEGVAGLPEEAIAANDRLSPEEREIL